MTGYDMDGQVFFVTGGGSGIGRASALLAARCGARVIVTDIDKTAADETASLAAEAAGAARAFALDVTDSTQVGQAVGFATDTFGRIDSAFNSAGVTGTPFVRLLEPRRGRLGRGHSRQPERHLALREASGGTDAQAGRRLDRQRLVGGRSRRQPAQHCLRRQQARRSRPYQGDCARYGAQGIRTNCICPGWTSTPMTEAILQGRPELPDLQNKRIARSAARPRRTRSPSS